MSEKKLLICLKKTENCYSPMSTEISQTCPPRAVKRNLNYSFEKDDESPRKSPRKHKPVQSPTKSGKSLTLVIDRNLHTSRFKYASALKDVSADLSGRFSIKQDRTITEESIQLMSPFNSPAKIANSEEVPLTPINSKLLQKECLTSKTVKSSPRLSRNTISMIRDGIITPKVKTLDKERQSENTPLKLIRNHLHVSYIPQKLPCREKEYEDLFSFLEGKLLDKCGGCMYISGVPGTGKTATVTSVINHLVKLAEKDKLPKFQFVNINGMKLTEPRQAYVEIVRQLFKKTLTWEHAQMNLEQLFTKKRQKTIQPIILVVDELDIIRNKRQDVVYNLLDWPTKADAQLIVIAIANTMNLPESLLMNRVTSRLGLTRLTFQAYTFKQLQEIVTKRLIGTNSFHSDAVQLVARKVASVSGDARRALDICRQATEIAESDGDGAIVSISHVNEALKAMVTQPKVRAIKACSKVEKFVIHAIVSEVERTGIEETIFSDVYRALCELLLSSGLPIISCTLALKVISRLSGSRLLLSDQKNHLNKKIILNVSPDDVYFALNEE